MALVTFAKYELEKAGLFDKDSSYGGMLGTGAMELVEKFAAQGHSGYSAEMMTSILERLLRYKTLMPIKQPKEGDYETHGGKTWQHKRCSSLFSEDKGKSWFQNKSTGQKTVTFPWQEE